MDNYTDTLTFAERLHKRITQIDSRVCLGIDPRPNEHPLTASERFDNDPAQIAKAVVHYFQAIIATTEDVVACYKLQSAFFEALGIPGLIALAQLIAHIKTKDIPVILDAKRGDIASTAEAYARAYLGEGVFSVDALTINPFLGFDSLIPFLEQANRAKRGVFILLKTSNKGSKDLQELELNDGSRLFDYLADRLNFLSEKYLDNKDYSPIGVVVGATYPEQLSALRFAMPHSIFLVPGYGAQGGSAKDVLGAFDKNGLGAVINASRGLTYLTQEDDFAEQARLATIKMRDEINDPEP